MHHIPVEISATKKGELRDKIRQDVRAFIRSGGKIQKLPMHASSGAFLGVMKPDEYREAKARQGVNAGVRRKFGLGRGGK